MHPDEFHESIFGEDKALMARKAQSSDAEEIIVILPGEILRQIDARLAIMRQARPWATIGRCDAIGEVLASHFSGKPSPAWNSPGKRGSVPYGMRRSENGTLAEDPQEQQVISLCLSWRREGKSWAECTRLINIQGFTSRSGRPFRMAGLTSLFAHRKTREREQASNE